MPYFCPVTGSGTNEEHGEKEQLMGMTVVLMDDKEKRKETAVKKKEKGQRRAKAAEIRDGSMKRMGEKWKISTQRLRGHIL